MRVANSSAVGGGSFAPFGPKSRRLFLGYRAGLLGAPEMLQRLLQVLWRIQVVLKEKLHGPLASFTALSHIPIVP